MLGRKYKPSPGREVRSAETIRSASETRLKPAPLSSTMGEKPPHTNMVMAPVTVAISRFCENLIRLPVHFGFLAEAAILRTRLPRLPRLRWKQRAECKQQTR